MFSLEGLAHSGLVWPCSLWKGWLTPVWCGHVLSGRVGSLRFGVAMFSAPNARPGNFKFTPSNGSVVHFSWEKIPEQDINGQLLGYEMQYRLVTGDIRKKRNVDCSGECDWTTIQLAANVSRYTVTGLKSARKYTFRIRARTPIPGPFAIVTVDTPSSGW